MKRQLWVTSLVAVVVAVACGRSDIYRYKVLADGGVTQVDAGEPDAGIDGGVDAGIPCIPGMIPLKKANPVVTLVIDRSSSMNTQFGNTTRWKALINALAAALPSVDSSMQIGALIYPVAAGNQTTCSVAGAPQLSPALNNVTPLLLALRAANPGGSTPTAPAVDIAAAALLKTRAAGSARALVLATDGAPDCNDALDFRTCTCVGRSPCVTRQCLDDTRLISRVSEWAKQGLPTYVIGIQSGSEPLFETVLNQVAVAGGRPKSPSGQRYYGASSQAELQSALVTIRSQVSGCSFLATSVPEDNRDLTLRYEGRELPFDPTNTNGWDWTDKTNGELQLFGETCNLIARENNPTLIAEVACLMP